ncbi:ABC transporter substrate-binding protein [Geminicoccaceae bacterium 1502E]|nr:ABC transporter substrate-binding protein [Geminicoccaceae bacterium 1502E]
MSARIPAALVVAAACLHGGAVQAATVAISCGAVGQELQVCREGAEAWAAATGNSVEVVSTPNSATERLALYQQILAAGSGDIDVFQIDVIWPGILAPHLIDLRGEVPEAEIDRHFPAIVENNTVDGRLVAMPWFTDAGLLYYRKDLLEKHGQKPPRTWDELASIAKDIQDKERSAGHERMWGYVYQAKAYEGLTCNALEWVASFGGGGILAPDGEITVANPQAAAALRWAASTVGTIAPEGVLNYAEEESRGVFQSGNAVFMRNWPYAWALAQAPDSDIRDKVGVTRLPSHKEGGPHAATLGGWQLAVSRYSANPGPAADLVRYLTSYEEQKRRALVASYNPTIGELYKDEEVLEAVPFFESLYETFVSAVARPSVVSGAKYNQLSSEFFNAVHAVLSGGRDAEESLAELEANLDRLSRGGRW